MMENPSEYLSCNSLQTNEAHEILEEHRNFFLWNEREHILDVGCGPGDVTSKILIPFLPKDSMVIGCDISEEMVKHGNTFYRNERLKFKKLDIEKNNIDNEWEFNYFNKVFSFNCLHWIYNHRQAMRNIYSLLKPSGDFLLLFLTPDNPLYLVFEKLKISQKWKKYMEDIKWFYESDDPPSFFEEILQGTGFEHIKCYTKRSQYRFPSWEAVLCFSQSVNPYLQQIPGDLKSEYFQDLSDYLKQEKHVQPDEVNGGFIVEYNLIIALGKKPK